MSTGLMRPCVSTLQYLALLCVLLGVGSVRGQTPVSGVVDRDTTWSAAGSPYVLSDEVEVVGGATLTILGGVQVHFEPESRLLIGGEDPSDAGRLLVGGSPSAGVIFEPVIRGEPTGSVEFRPGAAIQSGGGGSALRFARFISLQQPLTMRGSVALLQDVFVLRSANAGRAAVVVDLDTDASAALRATRLSVFESAGDGMSVTGGGDHQLVECRFADNTGRGLVMDLTTPLPPRREATQVLVQSCEFIRNTARDGNGGGALLFGSTAWTIEECLFDRNRSDWNGGGLALSGSRDSTVRSCEFVSNFSEIDGGGMSTSVYGILIEDCDFFDNTAQDDRGGGLAATSPAELHRCVFENNTGLFGGAVHGRVQAFDCEFVNNFASLSGGAMHLTRVARDVGVVGGTFEGNTAVESGGASEFDLQQGGREVRVEGARFLENSARIGGAIGGVGDFSGLDGVQFRFVGNHFEANLARRGGAIHVGDESRFAIQLDLSSEGQAVNRFTANLATTGPAIANDSVYDIDARDVCWGVPTAAAAEALIHDGLDDPALGIVAIDPIATVCLDCPQDMDGDGALTIFDFLVFQGLFAIGDPAADFDGDGALTLFDFLAFQSALDAGCP